MANVLPWRNAGETTNFPFRESATLLSLSERSLPPEFLVDAQLFMPAHLGLTPYLRSLRVTGSKMIGAIAAEDDTVIASFEISAANINNGVATLLSPDGAARGTLVFGHQAINAFRSLRLGENVFSLESTTFEPSCVFNMPGNVLHEVVFDGVALGKIAIAEGDGIFFQKTGPSSVRLDAKGSTSKVDECCNDPGEAIKIINTVVPNLYGNINFNLEPFSEPTKPEDQRQILRIVPIANGVEFFLTIGNR
jgi:hypothetical protein